MAREKRYTIGELGRLTGVTRRTVRYYVQRGLLPPPLGAGRGHYYTDDHLTRITAIRDLQAQGLSLDEIEGRFQGPQPEFISILKLNNSIKLEDIAEEFALTDDKVEIPTLLTRINIARGVDLTVESGVYRLSPARLRRLRKAVREILGTGFEAGPDEGEEEET